MIQFRFDDPWFRKRIAFRTPILDYVVMERIREKGLGKWRLETGTTPQSLIEDITGLDTEPLKFKRDFEKLFGREYTKWAFHSLNQMARIVTEISLGLKILLKHLLHFEWLSHLQFEYEETANGLSMKKKRYRDHIQHPVKVAYIGEWLMKNIVIDGKRLEIKIAETLKSNLLEKVVFQRFYDKIRAKYNYEINIARMELKGILDLVWHTWWIASFFHDIGLPFTSYVQTRGTIKQTYPFLLNGDDFDIAIDNVIGNLNYTLLCEYFTEDDLKRLLRSNKHGIIGAINLLLHLQAQLYAKMIPLSSILPVNLAAIAIFLHDLSGDIAEILKGVGTISFGDNPIPFLLLLCDEIQEWGRLFLSIQNVKGKQIRIVKNIIESPHTLTIVDKSSVKFAFNFREKETILTDWSPDLFNERKNEVFECILNCEDIFPALYFETRLGRKIISHNHSNKA